MKYILYSCFALLSCIAATAQKTRYKIVYNVLEDKEKDNYELYSMNMDGSDRKNITNTPGVEWVYYAYKNKVYYIKYNTLFIFITKYFYIEYKNLKF